jgi:diguanylate cyclase (GGDEF)-like protein
VPDQPVLILLVVAVAANLLLTAGLVMPPLLARREARRSTEQRAAIAAVAAAADGSAGVPVMPERALIVQEANALAEVIPEAVAPDGVPTAAYDRVVRMVSWAVILGASAFVAVTGLWPSTQAGILVVLAAGGFMVLLVHDIVPQGVLASDKYVLEGCLALTLVTLIVIMTGQETSPFWLAYPLIVAGAALVVRPVVTLVLTALASLDYVVAVTLDRPEGTALSPTSEATVAVNIVAMILLAFIASYIAREQRRSRQAAIRLSTVDSLTGLFNRAFFFAAVEREIQRSSRTGRRFGLLMMDLDELKEINDRFGHFHGDQVLRGVADVIKSGVRRLDTAARYGGDEFVVLLPETEPTGSYVLAEKIRQGVEDLGVAGPGFDIHTSISIGAVAYPDDGLTADDLLISADRAMYVSKRQGKNRVVGYAPAGVVGPDDEI